MSNTAEVSTNDLLVRIRADKYITAAKYEQMVAPRKAAEATERKAQQDRYARADVGSWVAMALMAALVSSPFVIHLLRVIA